MQQLLTFEDVKKHINHNLTVSYEGKRQKPTSVSIECRDCEDEPVLATLPRPETHTGFKRRKTRPVEMYVGTVDFLWATRDVQIPVTTAATRVAEVATEVLRRELEEAGEETAFFGVYDIPELADLRDEVSAIKLVDEDED